MARWFATSLVGFAAGLLFPALAVAAEHKLGPDPAAKCAGIKADAPVSIDSATIVPAVPFAVAERGPTPTARITPATPEFCRVLGRIAPVDPKAPPIRFQVNLPLAWNGRTVQYGGGGFNGVLITGVGLPPSAPLDSASPLAQGYVTYGTDSGHETKPGEAPQQFALNDEALVNFSHAAYKKVRDVAVMLVERAYSAKPEKLYFLGTSEGGREGVTMAQRYPDSFDGIFARVPVLNWTLLQHVGTRDGIALMGDGWLRPAQVKLVHDAVLAACDAQDGIADGLVADPVGCKKRFNIAKLQCAAGASGDQCLSAAQVNAAKTLGTNYRLPFPLANGVRDYPGRGPSGEGANDGWPLWWLGSAPPAIPLQPATNSRAWLFGAGAIQYFYVRDPDYDVRKYSAKDHAKRVQEVSALMDATNPDLSAFRKRGGKLIIVEHMADYAQSPYAGIAYFLSVEKKMGAAAVGSFARLYTAPGVDHSAAGAAPANVDMLKVLTDWVENGKAPGNLVVTQQAAANPVVTDRAVPLCQWPLWPRYKSGDVKKAESFACGK